MATIKSYFSLEDRMSSPLRDITENLIRCRTEMDRLTKTHETGKLSIDEYNTAIEFESKTQQELEKQLKITAQEHRMVEEAAAKIADESNNAAKAAKGLGENIEEAGQQGTRGFESLEGKITAANASLMLLSQAINLFKSAANIMQSFVDLSLKSDEVQQKLSVTMRNSMDATNASVQSMISYTDQMEKVGVLSATTIQAGAQELATYLTKEQSLKRLLPVLSDMTVQQFGVNASMESAANIASMLGKVMEGQVGALSRYGYRFDEVQENILKFGTEAERVATLVEVISGSVGGMNEAMVQTDIGQIAQLTNEINNAKQALGEGLLPFISQWQQMTSNLLLPALKFAADHIDYIIPIMKALGAATLVLGISAIPLLVGKLITLAGGITMTKIAMMAAVAAFTIGVDLLKQQETTAKIAGAAMIGLSFAIVAATIAVKAFKVALDTATLGITLLIGLAVTLVSFLISLTGVFDDTKEEVADFDEELRKIQGEFDSVTQSIEGVNSTLIETDSASKTYIEAMSKIGNTVGTWDLNAKYAKLYKDRLDDLIQTQNKTSEQYDDLHYVMDQLNRLMPGLNLEFDETANALARENDEILTQVDNIDELIAAYIKLAEAKARTNVLTKMMEESMNAQILFERQYGSIEEAQRQQRKLQNDMQEAAKLTDYTERKRENALAGDSVQQQLRALGVTDEEMAFKGTAALEKMLEQKLVLSSFAQKDQQQFVSSPFETFKDRLNVAIDEKFDSLTASQKNEIVEKGIIAEESLTKLTEQMALWDKSTSDLEWINQQIGMLYAEEKRANSELEAGGIHISDIEKVETVGKVRDPLEIKEEDLRMLHDIAVRDYSFNYQQVTPQLEVNIDQVNEPMDLNTVFEILADGVESFIKSDLEVPVYG